MATIQRTKTYAVCPSCGEDAGCIDHLLGKVFKTWWFCDSCGERYQLVFSEDGAVDITKAEGRTVPTVDVLVLKPQLKPVYFIVEGMRFEGQEYRDDPPESERKQFYYDEHSCPTNWLKPEMVYFDGDADPHGLLEFVATRDASEFPDDEPVSPNDHDRAFVDFIEATMERR